MAPFAVNDDHTVEDRDSDSSSTGRRPHHQGRGNIWLAGAWLGAGFHEDGLQAGLAAAEQIGGMHRPWIVPNESGRLHLPLDTPAENLPELARVA